MKILCLAMVEDEKPILKEIEKQTREPDDISIVIDPKPEEILEYRRFRIAKNHEVLRRIAMKSDADLIWQLEGDTVLEPDTLEKLIKTYKRVKSPRTGYVSGTQIGRHGVYMIGAWHFNEDESEFWSLDYKSKGLQQVDSTGFYCLLANRKTWLKGKCSWRGERWGPDSTFGLSLRKQGYRIYVDTDIKTGHRTEGGEIWPNHISVCNVRFYQQDNRWKYKTSQ